MPSFHSGKNVALVRLRLIAPLVYHQPAEIQTQSFLLKPNVNHSRYITSACVLNSMTPVAAPFTNIFLEEMMSPDNMMLNIVTGFECELLTRLDHFLSV